MLIAIFTILTVLVFSLLFDKAGAIQLPGFVLAMLLTLVWFIHHMTGPLAVNL
ncbi:DUF5993 family protein [Gammaproteobacteria bacterium]|nr:DUF5993 family protein [Gammaproteobacteria bacterium]